MRTHPRTPLAAVAAAALVVTTWGAATSAAPATGRNGGAPAGRPGSTALPGSMPTWANAAHRVGSTRGAQRVTFRVYLKNRDAAGAAAYARAVSTQGSPQYGKFLTPAQYRSRFSPSNAAVGQVRGWLHSQGFRVGAVPSNNKYVEASGTVAQAATSFHTSFARFRYQGHTLRANTSALKVPAALSQVQAVLGLDQSAALVHPHASAPAGFRNAPPCSRFWGEKTLESDPRPHGTALTPGPWSDNAAGTPTAYTVDTYAPCGYAGGQLQGAYGLSSAIAGGNDGRGVTVAVIDAYASSTIEADVTTYSQRHGLPAFERGQFRQVVAPGTYRRPQNPRQDPEGWSGEETLDIEAVHTMAPGANIVYVGAPNNYRDLDAIMNRVVSKHLADIVTNSYGYAGEALPPGYIKPQEDTYMQAAAEGISLFFSSGDSGDETFGDSSATPTPDWPASSPWVTAVGGTSLGVSETNTRVFELGWESGTSTWTNGSWKVPLTYLYGGGGGTSRLFPQPAYQAGVVPEDIATYGGTTRPARVVPDVSALGDPNTGMLVGQTQRFSNGTYYDEYRIGGTSLSSPLYAGMFALAVQKHGSYGLANPALYAAREESYDITKKDRPTYPGVIRVNYKNSENGDAGYSFITRTFDWDEPLTIHVRDRYDDVTGVGSPDGQAWLRAVQSYGG